MCCRLVNVKLLIALTNNELYGRSVLLFCAFSVLDVRCLWWCIELNRAQLMRLTA